MSMIRTLDENQGPSQLHGHGPWLMCEVALGSWEFSWRPVKPKKYKGFGVKGLAKDKENARTRPLTQRGGYMYVFLQSL